MYRYTTPTLPITIEDVDFDEVELFRIAIQKGNCEMLFIVEAGDGRIDASTNTILLSLTQEETARLTDGMGYLQVRIKYNSGAVMATTKARITINDVIDEVII